jgi:tryptophanyl-tRNA synthetase
MNILTGLQATGKMHLGNYLGAILPMIKKSKELKPEDKFFFFVPDLHSITIPTDYTSMYARILENVKIYIASGLDYQAKNIFLYRQSFIPAHSELCWILSCFSYYGEMQRMTQFKDKSKNKGENVSVGLFTYPVLMVADILLYKAEYIPLGDDQRQHLELARDLAIRINNKFEEEIFTVPKSWQEQLEFMNLKQGVRIKSLQNPDKKMSKSVTDPKGTISLSDQPRDAVKKIMSAVTDNFQNINWDWENQPGITNLLQILALLSNQTIEKVKKEWTGQTSYGDLKKAVAKEVEKFLVTFQTNLNKIQDSEIEQILQKNEAEVKKMANQVLLKIQKKVGLR